MTALAGVLICKADIRTTAALVRSLPVRSLEIRIVMFPKRRTAVAIIANSFIVRLQEGFEHLCCSNRDISMTARAIHLAPRAL